MSSGFAQRGFKWWAVQDLNLRPPRCDRGALPTELTAPSHFTKSPLASQFKTPYTHLMDFIKDAIKTILKFFLDIFQTFVIAMAMFVVLYQFAGQPHVVNGASMEPNFHDKEYLLTDKISYRFHEPQRGDVVIFHYPLNPEIDYIKRIVALPGEEIILRKGNVYINGRRLDESYLAPGTITSGHSYLYEGQSIVLKPNEYFVMGDNRSSSSDSREWGTVPRENIIGPTFFRYWPPSEIGLVRE